MVLRKRGVLPALATVLLIGGCGAGTDGGDGEYEPLLEVEWEVAAGEVKFLCLRETFEQEVVIDGFKMQAPQGNHWNVLTASNPNGNPLGPDGVYPCGTYEHNFENFVFESSVGPDPFEFPEGIATRIQPGQQVNLNVALVNFTDKQLSGTTQLKIRPADPAEVDEYATMLYAGKVSLNVPPGESTQVGECRANDDMTIFGALPHMHAHGSHQKVVAQSSIMGEMVVHDQDYDLDGTKKLNPVTPEVPLMKDDIIEVHCSYQNDTGETISWGVDAWDAEMCFSGLYVYPASAIEAPSCAN